MTSQQELIFLSCHCQFTFPLHHGNPQQVNKHQRAAFIWSVMAVNWIKFRGMKMLRRSKSLYLNGFFSPCYGSFVLPDTDSSTNSDSDSKPDSYIVVCRTCSHCMDSESGPYLDSYPILGWISIPGLGSESVSCNVNKPLMVTV